MRCLHLGTSSAIDKLQACKGAAAIICSNDGLTKICVSRRSRGKNSLTLLFVLERKWQTLFGQGGTVGKIRPREIRWTFAETEIYNTHKIFRYQRSNGGLSIAQT